MRPDPNDEYDRRRCRCCGIPWKEHPVITICYRHKPPTTPPWVADALTRHELAATASHLPPTVSDAEIAWRELAGGVPTREWPEAPSIPPRDFLAAVVARAHENKAEA